MSLLIHPRHTDKGTNSTNKPLNWGLLFLTRRTNSLTLGLEMFLWMLPPKGAVIFNPVGTNLGAFMPLGDPKTLVMSISWEDSTPPNKADIPHLTPTNQGDTTNYPAKWARIPTRGCISNRTSFILECLMVVLGCMEPNINR